MRKKDRQTKLINTLANGIEDIKPLVKLCHEWKIHPVYLGLFPGAVDRDATITLLAKYVQENPQ